MSLSDTAVTQDAIPFYISASDPARVSEAISFAEEFGYCFCPSEKLPEQSLEPVYVMDYGPDYVALLSWYKKAPGPVYVDFIHGALEHRRLHGGGRGEMIAKAVGLKGEVKSLHILDATAGLGRDAFVLAALGCRLDIYERHPVVYQLLYDGVHRARVSDHTEANEVVDRMTLYYGEADWGKPVDVIYLDPMFPERKKSSQVKKEMRIFKDIVGGDADSDSLLIRALDAPVKRVVVKRPKAAPFLAGKTPSVQLKGKSGRFDVYSLKSLLKE
ncbi:class I SAM-dependent methyltransferase [Hahella ganghwensis]|uniref:class I SAM-dependent methyltransferase n=1 Tax=Hahella ganghwensis TaxID=286420 RepID=UPI000382E4DD|nr:class I SAM-dependent methyltransferase [Hahella ganghwensis]